MEAINKTKRQGFTWDQEYKETVKDIEFYLKKITNSNRIENIEIFRLCLGIGYSAGLKRPTPPRKTDAVRLSFLRDTDHAVFAAIALSDSKDSKILIEEDLMYDVIEQYAAAGLQILSDEIKTQPDFAEWLTQKLYLASKNAVTNLESK